MSSFSEFVRRRRKMLEDRRTVRLGLERLEERELLAGGPSFLTAPEAAPSLVVGRTTTLAATATDPAGSESLTYTWMETAGPKGAHPTFGVNGVNAANDDVVTFDEAGAYTFEVTALDPAGRSASARVEVTVDQTLTVLTLAPAAATLDLNATDPLTASGMDQFGYAVTSMPALKFALDGGLGSVAATGKATAKFTASSAPETVDVSATADGVVGVATIDVVNAAPTVTTAAWGDNGGSTAGIDLGLHVRAADDGGQANLTYSWSVISALGGTAASPVTFSFQGTNAAQDTTATFARAGAYAFRVTITDAFGASVSSEVNVTVKQTVTAVVVTNAGAQVAAGVPFQVAAQADDQFGDPVAAQPTFSWSTVGYANGRVDANGVLTPTTFSIGATTDVRASADGKRGDGVFTTGAAGLVPTTAADYVIEYALMANADPTFGLSLPEAFAAIDAWIPTSATNTNAFAVATLTTEAALAAQLADLADEGLVTLPASALKPGQTTAERYREHAQALLDWIVFDFMPKVGQAGIAGELVFGNQVLVAYGTLRNTPGYSFSSDFETAIRTYAYYDAGGANVQFNSFSYTVPVVALAVQFFGNDHVGNDDAWFGPHSAIAAKLATYFTNVATSEDLPNPPAGYNEGPLLAFILTAELTGNRDAGLSLENLFARLRDEMTPTGDFPSVGDDFYDGGTDYALFFQYGARLFNDGSYLTAAERIYSNNTFTFDYWQLLSAGVGGMTDWLGDPSFLAPVEPAPLPTIAEVATRFTDGQDDQIIQRAGSSGTAPFLDESELDTNNMGHAHPDQAGATSAYDAGGVQYLQGTGRQFDPEEANELVLEPADQVAAGAFPYRNMEPNGADGGYEDVYDLNHSETFAAVDAAGDTYGSFEYDRYFADDTSERRETVLLPTGELIVLDLVDPGTAAAGEIAGTVWHLAGTTDTSPAPSSGTSSSGNAYFVGDVSGHNVLVTEAAAVGRTSGATSPPSNYLFAEPFGGYSAQNINAGSQTIYARQALQAGTPTSFVTVFQPNADASSANDVTITTDPNNPGDAVVQFRDSTGESVRVAFTTTGWSVERSPLPPTTVSATLTAPALVQVSWTAPTSNPAGALTGYTVERSTASDFSEDLVSQTVPATTTSVVQTGLTTGTTYYYRVIANYASGDSNPSNTAVVATPGAIGPTITTVAATLAADGLSAGLTVAATGDGPMTYTWAATAVPYGADTPSFAANGTAAAADTTATFSAAGTYKFTVTAADAQGRAVTDTLTVAVASEPADLFLNRETDTVAGIGHTFLFVATLRDQFGNPIAGAAPVWQIVSGSGTIAANGLFTNTVVTGTEVVRATVGTLSAEAIVTSVRGLEYWKILGADATTVTGDATVLRALPASDDDNESTYTVGGFAVQSVPAGAANPVLSAAPPGSNFFDRTVTFSQAGTYVFSVRAYRGLPGGSWYSGGFINGTVTVTVVQTPRSQSSLTVSPAADAPLAPSGTEQFTAGGLALDQFGDPMAVTWTLDPGSVGTISAGGLYTAPAFGGTAVVRATADGETVTRTVNVSGYAPPTVAVAAAAGPSPVNGKTASLSVLGAYGGGEADLTYTWTTTTAPSGAPEVTFSSNGTNASKDATATFGAAGAYTFLVTITDPRGLTVTSTVGVTVASTPTTLSISPANPSVGPGQTRQFTAAATDQFGNRIAPSPAIVWSVNGGEGSITSAGLYTAPASAGVAVVRAAVGAISAATNVTVAGVDTDLVIVGPSSATPNVVTGTTAALTVFASDRSYPESGLAYTWAVVEAPAGAHAPSFSDNGDATAKSATVRFAAAGAYTLRVTVSDPSGLSATSVVSVTVDQTVSCLLLEAPLGELTDGGSEQLGVRATDQFGDVMPLPAGLTWTLAPGSSGVLSASGYFTATAPGAQVVEAAVGAVAAAAAVTVVDDGPSVVTAAAASPDIVTGETTSLSVLGADDSGEANLTYSWAVASLPVGARAPIFSADNSNSAKDTTATFAAAGTYSFVVTITDPTGQSTTSSVTVVVVQTLTTLHVAPGDVTLETGGVQQFDAAAFDQFGKAMSGVPVAWAIESGSGSIGRSGDYTAADSIGVATVQAVSEGVTATAEVTTIESIDPPPKVVEPATAQPAIVEGESTRLSVLASDAALTYTWTTTAAPAGAPAVVFSANDSPAANVTTATFAAAGAYTFLVTITDPNGLTAASSVSATVAQTLSGIFIAAPGAQLLAGASVQLTLTATDQFGAAMDAPSDATWRLAPGSLGTLSATGLYTAGAAAGDVQIEALVGGLIAETRLTVATLAAPTAPDDLRAAVGDGRVTLNWSPVEQAATYDVYQSTTSDPADAVLIKEGLTAASFADRGLSDGITYYFAVSAADAAGESGLSELVPATPAAPIFVVAFTATPVSPSVIRLDWEFSGPTTSVAVERSVDGVNFSALPGATVAAALADSARDDLVTPGVVYYYRVTAETTDGPLVSDLALAATVPVAASEKAQTAATAGATSPSQLVRTANPVPKTSLAAAFDAAKEREAIVLEESESTGAAAFAKFDADASQSAEAFVYAVSERTLRRWTADSDPSRYAIEGDVEGAEGDAVADLTTILELREDDGTFVAVEWGVADEHGRFRFDGVPAGVYRVRVVRRYDRRRAREGVDGQILHLPTSDEQDAKCHLRIEPRSEVRPSPAAGPGEQGSTADDAPTTSTPPVKQPPAPPSDSAGDDAPSPE